MKWLDFTDFCMSITAHHSPARLICPKTKPKLVSHSYFRVFRSFPVRKLDFIDPACLRWLIDFLIYWLSWVWALWEGREMASTTSSPIFDPRDVKHVISTIIVVKSVTTLSYASSVCFILFHGTFTSWSSQRISRYICESGGKNTFGGCKLHTVHIWNHLDKLAKSHGYLVNFYPPIFRDVPKPDIRWRSSPSCTATFDQHRGR